MQPLFAERRHRTVARNKGHVVAQRQQLVLNGGDQLIVVAAREIAAPDAALKNDVAGNQQPRGVVKKKRYAPAYGPDSGAPEG